MNKVFTNFLIYYCFIFLTLLWSCWKGYVYHGRKAFFLPVDGWNQISSVWKNSIFLSLSLSKYTEIFAASQVVEIIFLLLRLIKIMNSNLQIKRMEIEATLNIPDKRSFSNQENIITFQKGAL